MDNPKKKRRVVLKKSIGPGLHAGVIELKSEGSYRVRLRDGQHVRARVDEGVSEAFVDECLTERRTIMVCDGDSGVVIAGALDTGGSRPDQRTIEAKELRLRADERIVLEVGRSQISLDKSGAAKITGSQLVIDVSALVKFLSMQVELP
jgi:hypothetical protein